MSRTDRILATLVVATTLAGCASVSVGSTPPTPKPASFDPAPVLKTVPAIVCHPTPITGQLESDPRDPQVAWLETFEGKRFEVVWPTGYTGRFIDVGEKIVLEVSDDRGRVFMGTHASPSQTCDAGIPGTVLLMQASI